MCYIIFELVYFNLFSNSRFGALSDFLEKTRNLIHFNTYDIQNHSRKPWFVKLGSYEYPRKLDSFLQDRDGQKLIGYSFLQDRDGQKLIGYSSDRPNWRMSLKRKKNMIGQTKSWNGVETIKKTETFPKEIFFSI